MSNAGYDVEGSISAFRAKVGHPYDSIAQEKLKRNRNQIVRFTDGHSLVKARLFPVASGESRCNSRDRL
jgi:hypothetical protein